MASGTSCGACLFAEFERLAGHPLVDIALPAMRAQPDGFPRYHDKAPQLSALIDKVLRGRNLLPGPGHSLYSLRHTFEDRLTAVEAPEKVMAALMGHKFHRPRYGAGPSLEQEQKQEWLQRIAFRSPARVQVSRMRRARSRGRSACRAAS
ncbi:hypothetical protein VQ03_26460 [Methylobacterium tarhaniae]|uniref:Tyr recombinase domain-containing protein n=1 Tax=Methylobacterium tarhaniae TaxID=1187852 RepID=A0A0J6SFS2_9HYPH|nr:hypothetical protein [Methylobacterium tarhaniae]KMO32218.1 hypothetical protein VQ03_26460 [Methylobacterium tarhaniae]